MIESFNIDFGNSEVDDIEDVEEYLLGVLEKVENKSNILHCLATIASYKGEIESAIKFYDEILEVDENDPIAHLNLGHFYFSHFEEDEKVKFHFNKYKELEPDSNEIESIETIMNNIS